MSSTEKLLTPIVVHQAVGNQTLHGPHRLGDGHAGVGPVDLIQVDLVHAQQAQALVRRPQHRIVSQVAPQHLGRDEHPVPDAGDGLAHLVLRAVHLRRVDQVGAEFNPAPSAAPSRRLYRQVPSPRSPAPSLPMLPTVSIPCSAAPCCSRGACFLRSPPFYPAHRSPHPLIASPPSAHRHPRAAYPEPHAAHPEPVEGMSGLLPFPALARISNAGTTATSAMIPATR